MDVSFMECAHERDHWYEAEAEGLPGINHTMVINKREYLVTAIKWISRFEVRVEIEDIAAMRQAEQDRIDDDETRYWTGRDK